MNMRVRERMLAICLLAFSVPVTVHAQEAEQVLTLDLKSAITVALSENPMIKVADVEVKKKDYSKKDAISGLFPKIDGSASYSRAIEKQTMYMDTKNMGSMFDPLFGVIGALHPEFDPSSVTGGNTQSEGGSSGMKVGLDNTYSLGFNATLPIIAPQLWKSISLSKADVAQAVEAARSSRLSMVNQVTKSYYGVLLAQDSYNVIKQSYDNAKLNAQNFRNKYEHGTASEYEVLRAEVQVRNLEPSLLSAESAVTLSKLQLKVLLGVDMDVVVNVEGQLSDYEASMYEQTLSIDTSLDQNTDLRQLDLQTAYVKQAVKVQQMAWSPTLAASAGYNWISMSDGNMFKNFRWSPYSTVALSLSVPIFQGGSRVFKEKQAKANLLQMGFQRDNLVRGLSMQVQSSMDNIQKSVKQVASNKEGVKQAEKAYAIMQKSFEIGSATFIEVNDADLALTSSKLTYNQAIYDFLSAKTDLELLLGNIDLDQYKTDEKK